MTTCSIRYATAADETRVVEMALRFVRETQYATLFAGMSPETLSPMFGLALHKGVVFVADVDGQAVGFLALVVLQHPFGGEPYGDELGWWVEPEWRRGRIGWDLLDAGERWARDHQVTVLKMIAPAGSPIGRLYEHRGYVPVETAYVKRMRSLAALN